MEKNSQTPKSESVTKTNKNPSESQHFPSHLSQFNMMQAVKTKKNKRKKKQSIALVWCESMDGRSSYK